ncbi:MAG: hypothetical protein IPL78_00125 [Chloroflexi bacterium]|nr:hypothetical protein [Chloroflexota bacterium]
MEERPVVRVAFLDVGQGDTNIVSVPMTQEAVIVDCNDADTVLDYLEREGIQHLRGLLVTHLHLDHYSGVVQLLDNLEQIANLNCERILFRGPLLSRSLRDALLPDEDNHSEGEPGNSTDTRKRKDSLVGLLKWAQLYKQKHNSLTIQYEFTLPLSDILELLHPWEIDVPDLLASGLNNTSAIIKVKGSGSSALLTGDIEPIGWSRVDRTDLQSDVLKFPHHGAWQSNDVGSLLEAVQPSVVVISVGTSGSRYNHPNPHVFEALAQLNGTRLLCTQATGQCGHLTGQKYGDVIESFKREAESTGSFFIERNGCPCAGTIVVELGDSVRILQPRPDFHRTEIIGRFYEQHKCNLQND